LELVKKYTYVGTTFKTEPFTSFATVMTPHYEGKAAKAQSVAHGVLHVDSMIVTLPPNVGHILYMGSVDRYLIYGCEIALDTND
ncbi:hypothetical protein L218DRAFT_808664, partial [Marasmius fiardii PR-910]